MKKKGNGKRSLECMPDNQLLIIDYPLSRVKGTHYISAIDSEETFWQMVLDLASIDKTVSTVKGRPMYQFTLD